MKPLVLFVAVLVSAVLAIVLPLKAEADDTPCIGALTGTFHNVTVPPGERCILANATVSGNVRALDNSRLRIASSNVRGNVEGDKAAVVQVTSSVVGRNISIREGAPAGIGRSVDFEGCGTCPPEVFCFAVPDCEVFIASTMVEGGGIQIEKGAGSVVVQSSVINGNVKLEENFISPIELLEMSSSVAQNLQVFQNTGQGEKSVSGNIVRKKLQCFENDEPFFGFGNSADQAEGQCGTAIP